MIQYMGIKERTLIELRLRAESPISILSTPESGTPIKKVLRILIMKGRTVEEIPVIPSSSFKGAIRALSESLSSFIAKALPSPENQIIVSHKRIGGRVKHEIEDEQKFIEIARKRAKEMGIEPSDFGSGRMLKEGLLSLLCPIDKLYGFPRFAGKLRFSDIIPIKWESQFIARTSIERDSLKVAEGRLFEDEVIIPGSEFSAFIIGEDLFPGEPDSITLALTLDFIIKRSIQLGSGKSIGRGRLTISKGEVYVARNFDALLPKEKGEKMSIDEFIDYLRGKSGSGSCN